MLQVNYKLEHYWSVVTAKHRVKYIVLLYFRLVGRIVTNKNTVGVRRCLIFLVYISVVLLAPLVSRQKRDGWLFVAWVVLRLMITRCHYFVELVELLYALWRGVHLADELSEPGIQSVVHVS